MARNVAHAMPPPPEAPVEQLRQERWHDHLLPAVRATVVTLVLTGIAYPLVMTGFAQVLFRGKAGGSFVTDSAGTVVGSELLAQGFARSEYVHPRPSAAGEKGYDPLASGGSNLGPTSKKLRDQGFAALERLRAENPDAPGPVPIELVTASGSGLDPHLSPAATAWQAPRVARARGVALDRIQAVIAEYTEGRDLALLGEPRVNVLQLNLALDRRFGAPGKPQEAAAAAPSAPVK